MFLFTIWKPEEEMMSSNLKDSGKLPWPSLTQQSSELGMKGWTEFVTKTAIVV